ncbi:GspE/PulE family protein [Prochlorococcus marinus]|uniref:General secretion pathway protein E n=1 Tax=Prochlorococcus marinus (strain MIT 9303) TaxID=59922 RepID=A2C5L6_PROM3|nr:GspE/PulE family protein [Prochlorococcus marinus]ABM76776.1 General secretion pathway protein E [Prochlorococcus marinus str. MIT 9303]
MLTVCKFTSRHVDGSSTPPTSGGSPHLQFHFFFVTQGRPIPKATNSIQQRLELELLLQVSVLSQEELVVGVELMANHTTLDISTWQQFQALPINMHNQHLVVAISDQCNEQTKNQLISLLQSQGFSTELRLALASDISQLLAPMRSEQHGESASKSKATKPLAQTPTSLLAGFSAEGVLEEDPEEQARLASSVEDLESSLMDSDSSPVINLVDRILLEALQTEASDVHVEPQQDGLQIRFRQDGVLQRYIEPLPSRLIPAVTSRFKIMADLDIAERRMAQDGRIRRTYRNRMVDFRVNSLPSRYGEKICLRLLDSSAPQLGLDKLISNPSALSLVRNLGSKPFGMILVTGPTGSGKSTTLYSLLAERNEPGINISTVEDPIEYTLPGITQCQVNREKGFDFSTALRAFMRQDPDVLLVGETRDLETAKTAIEAALTGHLVLTTLHCNDASSAIARLNEMGVEPFMVSASLIGIVSQRLLRRVCRSCRKSYHPTEKELGRFGLMAHTETGVTFFKAHHHGQEKQPCPNCQGSGYKGRVGVYEVLRMNEELATAVAKGATTDLVRRLALEAGMKTLLGYSLDLVREGHTTLEEVGRMILTDSGLESERRARALSTLTCNVCGAGLQDGWLECPYCLTARQ